MNRIKYQIFISSTYKDLKAERDQVIKACLEMGHIPVGMEMFSAADEEQWQIIARQIEESDYYVIIVANRYGSMVDGISYTEKEYDYAIEKGVPVLGFVLKDGAMWPSNLSEPDAEGRLKLDAFKRKVRGKHVGFWESRDELHAKCAVALSKAFNTSRRPGWLPATEFGGPEITAELSRLSTENAKLRSEVEEYKKLTDVSAFAQGEETIIVDFWVTNNDSFDRLSSKASIKVSWNELFFHAAVGLLTQLGEYNARTAINERMKDKVAEYLKQVGDAAAVKHLERRAPSIDSKSFNLLRVQFMALKLIKVEQVSTNEYGTETNVLWKLTNSGKSLYASMAALKSEKHIR